MKLLAGPLPVLVLLPAESVVSNVWPFRLERLYCFWLLPDCWGFMVRELNSFSLNQYAQG